jgi:hypothetical protein
MGDLTINGGKFGMWVGNQQCVTPSKVLRGGGLTALCRFTVRNVVINNAQTAVYMQWNWGKHWVASVVDYGLTRSVRLDLPTSRH